MEAAPRYDVKVELVKGWWVGNERRSLFRATNVGNVTIPYFRLFGYTRWVNQGAPQDIIDHQVLMNAFDDVPPGGSVARELDCTGYGTYICETNTMKVWAVDAFDTNPANDTAVDQIYLPSGSLPLHL
jgi:hypothetical protein